MAAWSNMEKIQTRGCIRSAISCIDFILLCKIFNILYYFYKRDCESLPFTVWLMTVASALACSNSFLRLSWCVFILQVKVSTNLKIDIGINPEAQDACSSQNCHSL